MEKIKVNYTCASVPPDGIQINRVYAVGKDSKGYYFTDETITKYCEIEYIKILFSPIGTTWDKVLASKKK